MCGKRPFRELDARADDAMQCWNGRCVAGFTRRVTGSHFIARVTGSHFIARVTGSPGSSHFIACYKITGGHTTLISHQTSRSHAISFKQQGSPTAIRYITILKINNVEEQTKYIEIIGDPHSTNQPTDLPG